MRSSEDGDTPPLCVRTSRAPLVTTHPFPPPPQLFARHATPQRLRVRIDIRHYPLSSRGSKHAHKQKDSRNATRAERTLPSRRLALLGKESQHATGVRTPSADHGSKPLLPTPGSMHIRDNKHRCVPGPRRGRESACFTCCDARAGCQTCLSSSVHSIRCAPGAAARPKAWQHKILGRERGRATSASGRRRATRASWHRAVKPPSPHARPQNNEPLSGGETKCETAASTPPPPRGQSHQAVAECHDRRRGGSQGVTGPVTRPSILSTLAFTLMLLARSGSDWEAP